MGEQSIGGIGERSSATGRGVSRAGSRTLRLKASIRDCKLKGGASSTCQKVQVLD